MLLGNDLFDFSLFYFSLLFYFNPETSQTGTFSKCCVVQPFQANSSRAPLKQRLDSIGLVLPRCGEMQMVHREP